jgi:2-(1,2-epoxy-1,2-dihydrophenyl)acetyl-CoA isomerase
VSVRFEVGDDHVGRLTLDRPEAANALTPGMIQDLIGHVRAAASDRSVRALLLSGSGGQFCSGMDLRESTVANAGTPGFDPQSTADALRDGVQALIRELWELEKPTVAAVDGAAVGPGAHLALACDFVLVHEGTRFLWSFHKWGLVADAGGAWLLPRLVGLPRARTMLLRGEGSSGQQAVEDGLATQCVGSSDELAKVADELAVDLAAGPTRALGLTKRLLNQAFTTTMEESLEIEAAAQAEATTTHDLVEGMHAFREKRDPRFEGR